MARKRNKPRRLRDLRPGCDDVKQGEWTVSDTQMARKPRKGIRVSHGSSSSNKKRRPAQKRPMFGIKTDSGRIIWLNPDA